MIVWLASYPRSGNTFFRVVLNNVFGIKTHSIYDDTNGIGADIRTINIVGHKFLPKDFDLNDARSSKDIYYIKTHELLDNIVLNKNDKIIYLVRDGRESSLSFAKYLQDFSGATDSALFDVLSGNTPFGSWGEHVRQWKSVGKLLIKFEDLIEDPSRFYLKLSDYLGISPISNNLPTFEELHLINPRFFRNGKKDSWKKKFSEKENIMFWKNNFEEMINLGYTDDMPSSFNK